MLIFPELETLHKYTNCTQVSSNMERFRKRAKSLFVVAPTAPTDNYSNFTERVKEYNAKEPFNFQNFLKQFETVSELKKNKTYNKFFFLVCYY